MEGQGEEEAPETDIRISSEVFTDDGVDETQYTLDNENGMQVVLSSFGATVTKIIVQDKHGNPKDCVLGFDKRAGYDRDIDHNPYFGATVGRVANRTKNSRFTIDGVETVLDANEDGNHLHGGLKGFSHRYWASRKVRNGVEFTLRSEDGDQKYPGAVDVTVKYTLTQYEEQGGGLTITMSAKLADGETKSTPINMFNHCYFNLAGHDAPEGIYNHTL